MCCSGIAGSWKHGSRWRSTSPSIHNCAQGALHGESIHFRLAPIHAHENKTLSGCQPSHNNNQLLLLTPADHQGGSQETWPMILILRWLHVGIQQAMNCSQKASQLLLCIWGSIHFCQLGRNLLTEYQSRFSSHYSKTSSYHATGPRKPSTCHYLPDPVSKSLLRISIFPYAQLALDSLLRLSCFQSSFLPHCSR